MAEHVQFRLLIGNSTWKIEEISNRLNLLIARYLLKKTLKSFKFCQIAHVFQKCYNS